MICTPRGSLLSLDELETVSVALVDAELYLESIIRSETPPRCRRTPEDRAVLASQRARLKQYEKLQREVNRCQRQRVRKGRAA